MKKILAIVFLFLLSAPAFACGGGALTGGATEWTQQLNNVLLESIKTTGLDEVYNTAQIVTKQAQQYTTQLQQFAEAVKSNFSMPFQVYNDLANSAKQIYSTVKGSGEGLFSYANADNWYNDMKNRSGWLSRYQQQQKTSKSAMKTYDDIITKDESEASYARDAEAASNNSSGATAAVQAGNRVALLELEATKRQTAAIITSAKSAEAERAEENEQHNQWLANCGAFLNSSVEESTKLSRNK